MHCKSSLIYCTFDLLIRTCFATSAGYERESCTFRPAATVGEPMFDWAEGKVWHMIMTTYKGLYLYIIYNVYILYHMCFASSDPQIMWREVMTWTEDPKESFRLQPSRPWINLFRREGLQITCYATVVDRFLFDFGEFFVRFLKMWEIRSQCYQCYQWSVISIIFCNSAARRSSYSNAV